MREYGYAAVAASSQAEAATGARRHRLMFWLYRRMGRPAGGGRRPRQAGLAEAGG